MKYIDTELLKTELKRLIKERDNMMKLGTYFSTSYVYEDILELIDSLQQEQQEEPDKDLEEAANEFANQDCVTFISRKKGFIAGTEWQKEQMMKDAVEGRVISNDGISFPVSNEIHRLKLIEGDKVKIIVVKEDKK